MTSDDWFTIERAAKHLGVSTRTLRRWIKAGKLEAELRPGPYGHQYLVPQSSVAGREVVRDLARAEREADRESVSRVLESHLAERESVLAREITSLREELQATRTTLEERLAGVEGELASLRRQLREHPPGMDR
jgi:MerR family copper efflux transcriptional regulator